MSLILEFFTPWAYVALIAATLFFAHAAVIVVAYALFGRGRR